MGKDIDNHWRNTDLDLFTQTIISFYVFSRRMFGITAHTHEHTLAYTEKRWLKYNIQNVKTAAHVGELFAGVNMAR